MSLLAFWALEPEELRRHLGAAPDGLSSQKAGARLRARGRTWQERGPWRGRLAALGAQLRSPLLLLLLFAALLSFALGQWPDGLIVLFIVGLSVGIGYAREYQAQRAATALRARVRTKASVLRDGRVVPVPMDEVVPGDVVELEAGSLVPGDGLVLEATDCFVSEALLTGESFPVAKRPGRKAADTPLGARDNCVFSGTSLRSGSARALIVHTGDATEVGAIAARLAQRRPETEFERGLRRFGGLLASTMTVMVLLVFAAHMLAARPVVPSLLFAVALAVGLSPELLPAILSVNLARGAQAMARAGVLVRHPSAIENLGSMDVLCTDKTGTLTEGVVRLDGSYGPDGAPAAEPLALAALNASLSTGLPSPLDDAIITAAKVMQPPVPAVVKRAEIPFDFTRKRVSVVVEDAGRVRLVVKGAFASVLAVCTELPGGVPLTEADRARLEARVAAEGARGVRVLAVATRVLPARTSYGRGDETALTFAGLLTFLDRPKPGVARALAGLAALGVAVKVITGDSHLVARHVANLVGLPGTRLLTGTELDELQGEALWRAAEQTDVFAEVDPDQKERIIHALKHTGHVVGFLGDGVNDAPAMHAADTSLSVEGATDVAREAADFVLLERDLEVIRRGIAEGRATFANTLKYILTTSSANLGNMVSMALASLALPFLPLTAAQILLNNFLSDLPAVGLPGDAVDAELVARPRRFELGFIARFMVGFGTLSSLFDLMTFALLIGVLHADAALFQTAWFVESLLTELAIALVVRTRRPCYRSRPGRALLILSGGVALIALATPYVPAARALGFVPLPPALVVALLAITGLYVVATELAKRWFYRPHEPRGWHASGSEPGASPSQGGFHVDPLRH